MVAAGACRGKEREFKDLTLHVHGIDVDLPAELLDAADGEADVHAIVVRELRRIVPVLDVTPAAITFHVGDRVIPEIGMTGFTNPTDGTVMITIDLGSRIGLRTTLEDWVGHSLAHELNHSKRVLDGPGYGRGGRATRSDTSSSAPTSRSIPA